MNENYCATISIIIVNWNTKDLLRECLISLFECNRKFEIIVIDNGSEDESLKMLRCNFPEIIIIENGKNYGFCRATNQGIEIAKGDYILLLNSDTKVNSQAMDISLSFLASRKDAGIVGCRLTYPDGTYQSSCFRYPNLWGNITTYFYLAQIFKKNYLLNWDRYGYKQFTIPTKVDCVMGSFFMIKRAVIEKCGMLDESYFMFAEETDFCYRAKKEGWLTYFLPGASIIHCHSGSQKNWSDIAWAYCAKQRGIFLFMIKWRSQWSIVVSNLLLIFVHLPKSLGWLIADLIDCIKNKNSFCFKRSLKSKILLFHLKAVFNPLLFKTSWQR